MRCHGCARACAMSSLCCCGVAVVCQVETLAQFGVVFLLFALGVEFSLSKMQGVHGVALGGGFLQILVAMALGGIFSNTTQGLFIGASQQPGAIN